jgi:hypothetical protein
MPDLSRALSGDLAGWHGLEPGLGEPELAAATGAARAVPEPRERVRNAARFRVLRLERDRAPEVVEAWFRLGDDAAAIVEFDPPGGDFAALAAEYGEAELTQGSRLFDPDGDVEDHVYADRGVTLSVARPHGADVENMGEWRRIVHVQLYPATSTTDWVAELGPSGEELRPYPPTL